MKTKIIMLAFAMTIVASCKKSDETQITSDEFHYLKASDTTIQIAVSRTDTLLAVELQFFPALEYDQDTIFVTGMWDPGSLKRVAVYAKNSHFCFTLDPWTLRKIANIVFSKKKNYKYYLIKTHAI